MKKIQFGCLCVWARLFQPPRRLADEAQIGEFRNVDRPLEEAELALDVDVRLQRSQIGNEVAAARIFLVGEQPAGKALRRLLGDAGGNCTASLWLAGSRYQRTTRNASSMKSIRAARFFSRNSLRTTHTIICVVPIASFSGELGAMSEKCPWMLGYWMAMRPPDQAEG